MIEVNHFGEVVQIRMGREGDGKADWGVPGQVLYWTSAYLIDGLLIDTGCSYTAHELAGFLEGKYVKLAVNTHYHEDHIGANAILKRKFGIPLFASRESIPLIKQATKLPLYQEVVWGYPEPAEVECLPKKIETEHLLFEIVETPGHCKGHIALVEPTKGWCFSGDLFVSREPKSIGPEEDIGETARSMRKLLELKMDRIILFTSMGTVIHDGRDALQACIEYFQDLSQKAKRLEKQGLSIGAIRDQIFGRETVLADLSEGDISCKNMIRAVLRADI